MTERLFSWAEARRIYGMGLPIFIAQLSQVGMNFVDTAMTGQASAQDMAAVAVAGAIWAPLSLLALGILLALPPLTAQQVGAENRPGAAHLLRQGIWLSLLLSLIFMGIFRLLSHHMDAFGLEPELAALSGGYLRVVLWGLPAFLLFVNLRSFFEGFSRTRPAMVISLFALALNVPCNYVLIYGKFGLPALGAVGCGVATAICFWFMALSMFFLLRHDSCYRDLRPLFSPMFRLPCCDPRIVWRIVRVGVPGALALFFEVSLFALTALMLAPLGTVAVAGHQIASSLSALVFMIPLALGMTTTIRVGFCLGAGRRAQARLVARTALVLSLAFALLIAVFTIAFRHALVRIYGDDLAVLELAVGLLWYVAAYQVVDGLQTVAVGALRGYNDTRVAGIVCFVAYWVIGLPLAYVLSRTDMITPALGPTGCWVAYLVALLFGACCYLARLMHLHRMDATAVERLVGR